MAIIGSGEVLQFCFGLLGLALLNRVAAKRRCRQCLLVCAPLGADQPQGRISEQVRARDFWLTLSAEFWVQQDLGSLNLREGNSQFCERARNQHLEPQGHFPAPLFVHALIYATLPSVITWRFARMYLEKVLFIHPYWVVWHFSRSKYISNLFSSITISRKPWERLHEQI